MVFCRYLEIVFLVCVKLDMVMFMKEKFIRFMQGRYGNDALNNFIFGLELVLCFLSIFFRNWVLQILFYVTLILYFYRAFSRNYVARSIENQKFIGLKSKIVHRFQAFSKNLSDQEYKTLVCPHCSQMIRVPKHKGKIEVKCSSCGNRFDAKS